MLKFDFCQNYSFFYEMARNIRSRPRISSRQLKPTSSSLTSFRRAFSDKVDNAKKSSLMLERRDWKGANCSVCMEYPHNAVLLLCSSHDKGCRPYMCATNYRYSNCLEQFKKAISHSKSSQDELALENAISGLPVVKKSEASTLKCPLCRGQVKGWTVVEPARKYLNRKKRGCMQENCSYAGNYKQLRKHVRAEHPRAKRRLVDPVLEEQWKVLENQREHNDVMSIIGSSMPRSVVWGDYVIDFDASDPGTDYTDSEEEYGDDILNGRIFQRGNNRSARRFLYGVLNEALPGGFRLNLNRSIAARAPINASNHQDQQNPDGNAANSIHYGTGGRVRRRGGRSSFIFR